MPKAYKIDKVADLEGKFEKSKNFILVDYRGLTVQELTEIRNELMKHNVIFKVVKNNLAKIALNKIGVEKMSDYLAGPTSVVFTGDEAPAAAKVLDSFQSKTSLVIKAGYIDGALFDPDGIIDVSKLPSKTVILSQIAGGLSSFLSRFAGDMQSVLSTFACTVKAIEDKKAAG